MRRRAGEEGACGLRLEARLRGPLGGAKRSQTETCKCERVTGNVNDRPEEITFELGPVYDQGLQETAVRVAVAAELGCGVLERASREHRCAVVERMSNGSGRLDQIELELQRAEERRGNKQRMDRGADVVAKTGKRQLRRARSAADRLLRLDDTDGAPGLCKRDRSGEAVRPGADYDRV